jgi:hypothetical protein
LRSYPSPYSEANRLQPDNALPGTAKEGNRPLCWADYGGGAGQSSRNLASFMLSEILLQTNEGDSKYTYRNGE